MKDNAEMFVEMYNSGGKQANSYVEKGDHYQVEIKKDVLMTIIV